MTDVPQERTDLPQQPYRPFPSFAQFAATDVDLATVAEFVAILEEAKAQATPERLNEAVRRATKWAAVDTGAIEGLYDVDRGFTFTVAAEAAAWNAMQLQIGDQAARSINDALAAYDYVLDVVTDSRPITETWIKELHEVICASQETYKVLTAIGMQEQPLPRGVYKTQPNNPFNLRSQALHGYAPVSDTPAEMHRMIEQLATDEFAEANPVLQAAYAHYAFVCIHPFADGNGRVARALASVFLYRSPGVPLVIFADQKPEYLDALEAADAGGFQPFVTFLADRAVDVTRMIVAEAKAGRSNRSRTEFEARMRSRGGRRHEEVDALATRLNSEWRSAIERCAALYDLSDIVTFRVDTDRTTKVSWPDQRWRILRNAPLILLAGDAGPPTDLQLVARYAVGAVRDRAALPDLVIVSEAGIAVEDALFRELDPVVSSSLRYRLDVAADREVVTLVDHVSRAVEQRLKQLGYLD